MGQFIPWIILIFTTLTPPSTANPVIYRLNEGGLPGEVPAEQEGKWLSNGRGNYFREMISRVHPDSGAAMSRSGAGQQGCSHQQYTMPNVGQTGSGYYRHPSNYPYMGYPVLYYYTPSPSVAPVQQHSQQLQLQLQQQQQPLQRPKPTVPVDQFPKQAVAYEQKTETTTPRPKPPGPFPSLPSISYPITGSWQSYVCSVLPYLPSCQPQTQPSPISSYGYNPYPGYSQMAQYPVYYIVQPDVRPSTNVIPGSIGYIKIIGPATIKPEIPEVADPVDQDVNTGIAQQDVDKKPSEELESEIVSAEGQDLKSESTEGKKPGDANSTS